MLYPDVPDLPGVPPLPRDPLAAVPLPVPLTASTVVSFTSTRDNILSGNLTGVVTGDLTQALSSADDWGASADVQSQGWGVFDDTGNPVLFPTSFLGIEYRNSTRLSNYPLEQGAFETYNKVTDPFDIVVGVAHGGNLGERADFLASVNDLAGDLNTYSVVTPEEIFPSVNLQRYDYARKTHNGATLIIVNLYFTEVRISTESEFVSEDETAPTVAEAQDATTAATSNTSTDAPQLSEQEVRNPASASAESGGQTQAQPATAKQAAPAADAPPTLPTGYAQDPQTGLIKGPDGQVDRDLTIKYGAAGVNMR